MKITMTLLLLWFALASVKADPRVIRVIFLSREDQTTWQDILNIQRKESMLLSQSRGTPVAPPVENDYQCEPFGEGCFHPQYGYIEDPEKVAKAKERKATEVKINTINAEEVDLINCDKEYYFDMYCGKAKERPKGSPYQIWVDVSSSMRQVDFSVEDGYCERRRLVAKVKNTCKEKVRIYTFTTSRKLMSSLDSLCLNSGTNDGSRMVKWLKDSQAENVTIITDVDEYVGEFREYLDLVGADIEGIGLKPMPAHKLYDFHTKLEKRCL